MANDGNNNKRLNGWTLEKFNSCRFSDLVRGENPFCIANNIYLLLKKDFNISCNMIAR